MSRPAAPAESWRARSARGAAFDVFLSADTQFPQELVDDGFAVPEPVVDAIGTLGLYSRDRDLSVDGEALLAAGAFASLAIADPTMAPYGMAAIQTLESLGLLDQLESTLVFGNNVAEALDLVETGASDAGFVAFPDLDADQMAGAWLVPADLHTPIDQAAVQLTAAPDPDAAAEWLSYLVSEAAGSIIEDAGYRLP